MRFHASETNSILLGAVLGAHLSPVSLLPVCPGSKASMGLACGTVGPRSTRRQEPGPENPCVTSARSLVLFVQHTSQKAFVCLSPAPSPQGVGLCYQPHLMEDHLMAQRVGSTCGYPVSAKTQTLHLGPGFCCSAAVVSHGGSLGSGEAAVLAVATSSCFSVLGLALGDLLG